MAPFARDLGHDGPPFPWDARRPPPPPSPPRRPLLPPLRPRPETTPHYILSTFPIIQRQDQAAFGHYRTKALILAYMNALAAGDTEARMAV